MQMLWMIVPDLILDKIDSLRIVIIIFGDLVIL